MWTLRIILDLSSNRRMITEFEVYIVSQAYKMTLFKHTRFVNLETSYLTD
jgi:hypothetical protein